MAQKTDNDIDKIVKKSSEGVKNQVVKRGFSLMMFPLKVMQAVFQDISDKLKK